MRTHLYTRTRLASVHTQTHVHLNQLYPPQIGYFCTNWTLINDTKMLSKLKHSQTPQRTLKFHEECSLWMIICLRSHGIQTDWVSGNPDLLFFSLHSLVLSSSFLLLSLLPCGHKAQSPPRNSWLFQMSGQTLYTFSCIHSSSLNLGGSRKKKSQQRRSG